MLMKGALCPGMEPSVVCCWCDGANTAACHAREADEGGIVSGSWSISSVSVV